MHENGPYAICEQCMPRSACALSQANLNLHYTLTESMYTVLYDDEQRSDYMDVHADLDLGWSHLT